MFFNNFSALFSKWWQGHEKRAKRQNDSLRAFEPCWFKWSPSEISNYNYRPFLNGFAVIDDNCFKALKDAPGDGTRARPEIRPAFAAGAKGICLAPNPIDLGSSLTRFASFAWCLPDDVSARNAMVYCSYMPDLKPAGRAGEKWDSSQGANFSKEFLDKVNQSPEGLFFIFMRSYPRIGI